MSEETTLRKLLVDLTDHVLELKVSTSANNKVIAARLDEIERDVRILNGKADAQKKATQAVAMLAGDGLKKVNELHRKVIGSADHLGKRLFDLEQEREKRGNGRSRRPPGRG